MDPIDVSPIISAKRYKFDKSEKTSGIGLPIFGMPPMNFTNTQTSVPNLPLSSVKIPSAGNDKEINAMESLFIGKQTQFHPSPISIQSPPNQKLSTCARDPQPPADKVPWFLQPSYGGGANARTEKEKGVAEILVSLKNMILQINSNGGGTLDVSDQYSPEGDTMDSDLSTSREKSHSVWRYIAQTKRNIKKNIKYKRNLNACTDHRRRHQRCPAECPSRKREQAILDQQPQGGSQEEYQKEYS